MPEGESQFSPEEMEEAREFNKMVDEGKLTPVEASQVEKDKTPEEVEAEREAKKKAEENK